MGPPVVMSWKEKLDDIEHAADLCNDQALSIEEFKYIKRKILEFIIPEQDTVPSVVEQFVPNNDRVTPNIINHDELESAVRQYDDSDSGQESHINIPRVFDAGAEIANKPMKRFKDDFNRINAGDSAEANYY